VEREGGHFVDLKTKTAIHGFVYGVLSWIPCAGFHAGMSKICLWEVRQAEKTWA
jgi:hypothetical protein